ncbi:hypothetical protein KY332_02515 [Candidatus Woesearchaeota archaeon]|nr:hypothetical protein [Candidatus Woesearchaeota archaeon]
MGWFRNLFKKELEKAQVNVNDLSSWFSEKTKARFEELNREIGNDIDEIKAILGNLKENLTVLNNAEIKDADKIQDKVKQIVIGHRESYCRVLSHFVNNVELPEEVNYTEGKRVAFDIDEGLTQIGKSTAKSYQAVQHLFSEELEKVAKDLKRLSAISNGIKGKIEKSGAAEIDMIKQGITKLIDSIKKNKDFKEQLREKREIAAELENKKKANEEKIESLKQSGDYKRLQEYNKRLGEVEDSLKYKKHEIIELFSPIQTGLKKFERITLENEKMVRGYADSPVKALFDDKELKIIELLQNMEKSILSGSVDLRDKKKERVLKGIENIYPQRLKTIISEHGEWESKREEIKRNINSNPIKSQIKEVEYQLEHDMFSIGKQREDVELTEKKYNQINLEELKNGLQERIKERISIEVIISFS